jgi:hypothetical protein
MTRVGTQGLLHAWVSRPPSRSGRCPLPRLAVSSVSSPLVSNEHQQPQQCPPLSKGHHGRVQASQTTGILLLTSPTGSREAPVSKARSTPRTELQVAQGNTASPVQATGEGGPMTSQCPQAALVLVTPTQASFPAPDLPNSSAPPTCLCTYPGEPLPSPVPPHGDIEPLGE